VKIWQSMGVYLGYGIAHYADFYDLKHVLILGRCTSGRGGELLIEGAKQVWRRNSPNCWNGSSCTCPMKESAGWDSPWLRPACL
jgi:hypothetical protein